MSAASLRMPPSERPDPPEGSGEGRVDVPGHPVVVDDGAVDATPDALGPTFEDLVAHGVGEGLHRQAGDDLVAVEVEQGVQFGEGEVAEAGQELLADEPEAVALEGARVVGQGRHPASAGARRPPGGAVGHDRPELRVEGERFVEEGAAAHEPVDGKGIERVELGDELRPAPVEEDAGGMGEPGEAPGAQVTVLAGGAG